MKKTISKAQKLTQATDLNAMWNLLNKDERGYASYLVNKYGYTTNLAIQRAYIFGFDSWPYDYRNDQIVRETQPRSAFYGNR